MAEIKSFLWLRHLRAQPSSYILHHRGDRLAREGRGLSFWFLPLSSSVEQIPLDDREVPFHFHGRSVDFQDVTVQGVITYRVVDPSLVARRIDFAIDLKTGAYTRQPLENISLLLTQLGQQFAWQYVASTKLDVVLRQGFDALRENLEHGFKDDHSLHDTGLEIVSVRVNDVSPTSELERALQMPTLETIQQQADEATFKRRALAVEKEREIQENELQTKLELARREEQLIEQRGANARREASEGAAARKIEVEADAEHRRIGAEAQADSIRVVETAEVDAERERMEIYRELPARVMMGLAARELAAKLERIDHLNLSPEMLGPLLTNLVTAGTRRLEQEEPAEGDR